MPSTRDQFPPLVRTWKRDQGYWIEAPGDVPGWHTAAHIVEQDGRLVVAELRIIPARRLLRNEEPGEWDPRSTPLPAGGFLSKMIRQVRPYRLVEASQALFQHLQESAKHDPGTRPPGDYRRRPGRQPKPDSTYAELAERYVHLCKQHTRNPIEALARERAGPSPSNRSPHPYSETVRWQLKEARRRELLTPPPAPGRAGGVLTAKGLKTLAQCREHDHGPHPEAHERS